MHEMSIAQSLSEQVRAHLPDDGSVLRRVHVRVGPLQAIEPQAMAWAWEALTVQTPWQGSELVLEMVGWTFACRACEKTWTASELQTRCACGGAAVPSGGDELMLMA
ncbi:MAG: hydrogenase maturation nickel metallochaperone HypA, partial [Phycisphaeraceae bacterium]|nr:hydrogenase maturation nickel metallochaperone HypA [Phycisphaeraceae bacterium]